jgi:hypothetical protein
VKQIRIRWVDLGSPIQPGTRPHMVEVTPGDIKLAGGNPDTLFVAIHPDFYSDETPYLLSGVEFPGRVLIHPITGIAGCCALAASGHATAAPPTSEIDWRVHSIADLLLWS